MGGIVLLAAGIAHASVAVTVSPTTVTLAPSGTQTFTSTVTGSTNTQVTWSVSTGGGSITSSGIYTAPTSTGTYTVTATSKADTTKKATATVTVANVQVSVSPASATMTTGTSKTFTTSVTGTSNTGVTWSAPNGGSITTGGSFTAPATPGAYLVRATSKALTSAYGQAAVTVVAQPVATITAPSTVTTGTGGWTASVPAQSGSTYAWTITHGSVTSGAGTNAIVFSATTGSSLSLSCKVTNAAGTATTGTKTVSIVAAPSITDFEVDPSAIPPGGTAQLYATFTGGTGSVDQGVGAITNNTPLDVSPADSITYTLTVTNAAGTAATAEAMVTIAPLPVATLTVPAAATVNLLGAQASVPDQPGCSYHWTITNGTLVTGITGPPGVSSDGGATVGFKVTTAGTPVELSCLVSNDVGSVQGSATIPAVAAPDTTITGASLVQAGAQGVTASVPSISGCTYQWTIQGGTLTSASNLSSITYNAPLQGVVQLSCQVTNAAGTSAAGSLGVSILNQPGDFTGVYTPSQLDANSNPVPVYSGEIALSQVGTQVTGYILSVFPSYTQAPSPSVIKKPLLAPGTKPQALAAVEPVATPWPNWGYYLVSGTVTNGVLQCEIRQAGSLWGTMVGTLSSDGLTLSFGSTPANGATFLRMPGQPAVILAQSEVVLAGGAHFQFNPSVIGAADPSLSWDIQNAPGESITQAGLYTAPSAPGIYAVTARLASDPGRFATVMIQVTQSGKLSVDSFLTGISGGMFQDGSIVQADWTKYNGGPVHYFGTLTGSRWTGIWQQGASSGAFDFGLAADTQSQGAFQPLPFFSSGLMPGDDTSTLAPPYGWVSGDADPSAFVPYFNNAKDWTPISWTATSGDVIPVSGLGQPEAVYLPSSKPGISFMVAQSVSQASAVVAIPYIQFVPRAYDPLLGVYATNSGELQVFSPTAMTYDGHEPVSGLVVWKGSPYGDLSTGLRSMGDPSNPNAYQGTALAPGGVTIAFEVDFSLDLSAFIGTWQVTGQAAQSWSGTRLAGTTRVRIAAPYATLVNTGAIVPLRASVAGGADRDVIWSCSGGTISPNGFFTAPGTAGTYTVTATSAVDTAQSDSVTFTVVDYLLHQNLIATYGGGSSALVQDGSIVWVAYPNTLFQAPMENEGYTLEGHTLISRELRFQGTIAPDGSSFNGMSRDAQPADVVVVEPFYVSTTPGQTVPLKVLATGTPAFSALYGTVSSQGVYTAPAFPARDVVTARQGSAYTQITIDVVDTTQLDPTGVFKTLSTPTMQVSVTRGMVAGQLQGFIPSTRWGTQIQMTGTLQGSQWTGTWTTAGDSLRAGAFKALFGPTGDSLDLWLSAGPGPLGGHFVFQRPAQVFVSPSNSLVQTQATQAFTAKVLGQMNQAITWSTNAGSAGSISSTGVFTAGATPGTYTVTANATGAIPGTATVQVYTPYPLIMQPASLTIRPGASAPLQALSSNAYVAFPVSWSVVEGGGGSVTGAGVYTAPATPGVYHVLATSTADSTETATATVVVSPTAPIQITITPGSIALSKSGTTTFTAQVEGAANPALTWSCTGGSIDPATGAYTAPGVFGTYLIQATSVEDGTYYADATVTVQPQSGIGTVMTYDANGNLLVDGTRSFTWDAENRLVSVTDGDTGQVTRYTYDGLGRRVEITEQQPGQQAPMRDTKYLWDGAAMAQSRTPGGVVLQQYYQQGFVDTDGTALYYTRDHQGSVRELTDSSQALRARYDYDPFGRMTKLAGDKDSPFLFTGDLWNAETGLYLAMAREYDPNLGRWISRDPAGNVDGANEYAYVQNRVVNATDPTGLWTLLNPLSWLDGDHYQGLGTEFFTHDDFVAACGSTLDGMNPFGNPFSDLYDPCDTKYKISKAIAGVSSQLIAFASGELLGEAMGAVYDSIASDTIAADVVETDATTALRQAYVEEVRGLEEVGENSLAAGANEEDTARMLHQMRRDLGEQYKNMTPPDALEQIYARNMEKYGDKLGPSIDYLRSQGKSWRDIIESASRPGGHDLGL